MITNVGDGPEALLCGLMLWAFGLYILYWVIRIAARHALNDVGFRYVVPKFDDDGPPSDSDPTKDHDDD